MSRVIPNPRFALEALRGHQRAGVKKICVASKVSLSEALAREASALGVPIERVSVAQLDRMAEGVRHQGVLVVAEDYRYAALEDVLAIEQPLLLALDQITDPHNLGAMLRSAVAFGVDAVMLPKRRGVGVTSSVVRTSAGATEHAKVVQVTNLQRTLVTLHKQGLQVIGLAAEGDMRIGDWPPALRGRVLVIGSEGKGLSRLVSERCDWLARIPQHAAIQSLNASVAAGIALYEAARTR